MPSFHQQHRWPLWLLLICLPALGQEIVAVNVTGVSKSLARNVRAHLDLSGLPCTVTELQLRNRLRGSDERMFAALRALGFYQATWTLEHRQTTVKKEPCWVVDVAIAAGEPTLITTLDIALSGDGENDPQLRNILNQLPLKQGERLNHSHYDTAKKQIRQTALALGYFEGSFTEHRLAVDREANTAAVTLRFHTGPRYRFGAIRIADDYFRPRLFEGYQPFASGDPFDAAQLIQLQNNLLNAQYFAAVEVDQAEPDKASRTVDIDINVSLKRQYESTFGAGFSTDLGPKLNYQLRNRRFNRDGDTYVLSSQFSPVQSHLGLQYQQPGKDPINEKTVWSTGWKREDNDSFTSQGYNADVSRIRRLNDDWVRTTSLSFLFEDFDVGSDEDNVVLVYPGIGLQKTSANDPLYPTQGWRLAAGVRGGVEELLSSTSFFQANLDGKAILPLAGGRLIARTGLGATFTDNFAKMPATLRFFAGGDNSVRGYGYESLGPTDDDGNVLGGKYLATGSVEYDYRVYGDYSLALFYDAGNAFDFQDFDVYQGAGIGVRWHSPIGTIRVDLAVPLDDTGFQVHLSMGPDL